MYIIKNKQSLDEVKPAILLEERELRSPVSAPVAETRKSYQIHSPIPKEMSLNHLPQKKGPIFFETLGFKSETFKCYCRSEP